MFVEEKALPEVPVKKLEPWQDVCLKAADYIDKHGWAQCTRRTPKGEVCIYGALKMVVCGAPFSVFGETDPSVLGDIYTFLKAELKGMSPIEWNDTIAKSKEEVTGLLRRMAD